MCRMIWLLFALLWSVAAQNQFVLPDGSKDDFTERWTVGSSMNISWTSGWEGVGDPLSKADLWITWYRSDLYVQLLLAKVTFDRPGFLNWRVNVSNDVVNMDNQFVLRLKPHSDPPMYTSTQNESPSRGFRLTPSSDFEPSSSTTATTSSTSTTILPSGTTSTIPTASVTASETPSSPTEKDSRQGASVNTAAIVGGVVGGVVFIAMLGVILFLLHRLKRTRKGIYEMQELDSTSAYPYRYAHEIQGNEILAEADDGRKLHELK